VLRATVLLHLTVLCYNGLLEMVVFGPRPLFKTLLFPGSNNDMLRQFELFLDLFHILYKISDLWLTVGEVRVASLYISDGITLSRLLLLPERFV